jgi:hypothetical protein
MKAKVTKIERVGESTRIWTFDLSYFIMALKSILNCLLLMTRITLNFNFGMITTCLSFQNGYEIYGCMGCQIVIRKDINSFSLALRKGEYSIRVIGADKEKLFFMKRS